VTPSGHEPRTVSAPGLPGPPGQSLDPARLHVVEVVAQRGLVDRFRSLPIARSVVVADRIVADELRTGWGTVITVAVGAAFGFRLHTGAASAAAAFGLMIGGPVAKPLLGSAVWLTAITVVGWTLTVRATAPGSETPRETYSGTQRGQPRGRRRDPLVGGGQRHPDVPGTGRPVHRARRDQDPAHRGQQFRGRPAVM
jgi:hypothetical protein